jgi:hypothetical protein
VPTDIPVSGSYRFSWRVVLPDGSGMCRFGYVLKNGPRLLSFTSFSETATEAARFTVFVRSVRLL